VDRRSEADARPAPVGVWATLRYLGPGLIVTGSIVGSGELIITTRLGAEVGFAFLWLILLSCAIKVFVQIELGRYTISSGETALEALDRVPGPRLGASWVVWWWLLMLMTAFFQIGGIVGGVGQALNIGLPLETIRLGPLSIPFGVTGYVLLVGLSGMILLYRGRYRLIERTTTAMVFLFTAVTVGAALLLERTPYAITGEQLLEGLSLRIPEHGVGTAFAMFGITGVGASELIYYPYWCLEKGYARFVGPRSDSPAWAERAWGWVRVLKIDAWLSMVVYTVTTIAFYLLGAAVLHARGELPDRDRMMAVLSNMYVETIGRGGLAVFLAGSFAVLYSTFFVGTASNARALVDGAGVLKLARYRDLEHRRRWIGYLCLLYPVVCCLIYLVSDSQPVFLIKIGATVQAVTLPVIAASAIYLRYRHTDARLRPGRLSDLMLFIAAVSMTVVSAYQAYVLLSSR
jgi:Mn2+/Fe2+ NRAMP family transporter